MRADWQWPRQNRSGVQSISAYFSHIIHDPQGSSMLPTWGRTASFVGIIQYSIFCQCILVIDVHLVYYVFLNSFFSLILPSMSCPPYRNNSNSRWPRFVKFVEYVNCSVMRDHFPRLGWGAAFSHDLWCCQAGWVWGRWSQGPRKSKRETTDQICKPVTTTTTTVIAMATMTTTYNKTASTTMHIYYINVSYILL